MPARHALSESRKARGFTQELLAELIEVERSTVARWERGESSPTVSKRSRLAETLGISLADLNVLLENDFVKDSASAHSRAGVHASEHNDNMLEHPDMTGKMTFVASQDEGSDRKTTPTLVLVGGHAGSGKTEFALRLSEISGWCCFDKDVLTRALAQATLIAIGQDANDRQSREYLEKVRPLEYLALMSSAVFNINHGISTIAAAPFLKEFWDEYWLNALMATLRRAQANLAVVWIYTDAEMMHYQMQKRDASRDVWKLANWHKYIESIDLNARPICDHFFVDNSGDSFDNLYLQCERLNAHIKEISART